MALDSLIPEELIIGRTMLHLCLLLVDAVLDKVESDIYVPSSLA